MQTKLKEIIFKYSDLICIIFIVIICLIFFLPYIFSSPTPLIFPVSDLGTDLDRDVLPTIEYIVNSIKTTGKIPLWREFLLSGAPLVGHPSFPIFYPLYWLLLIIPIPMGLNLIAFINLTWMGIGMYLYLRISGGYKSFSSLLGGIAMALSPKWIAHLSGGHWFMLTALSWTSWSLLFLGQFWKTRKIIWLFFLSVALSAIGVNHLPIFFITSLTLAFISISYLDTTKILEWFKTMSYGWGIVIILTILLSTGQILPLIELLPHTIHTTENSTFTSLHPIALLTSIFPPSLKYPEWFLFPGLTILLFASMNDKNNWKKFEKIWLALGLIGLIFSLGDFTPVYSLLFGWNPLISVLRVPTRWWLITIIAIIVLFTSGFSNWKENDYRLNKRQIIIVSIILLIEIIAGVMKIILGESFPFDTVYSSFFAIFLLFVFVAGHVRSRNYFPGIFLLLLIFELFMVGKTLIRPQDSDFTEPSQEIINQIDKKIQNYERIFSPGKGFPAINLVRSNLHAAEGYDALPLENYMKFIRIATGCPLVQEATGSQEEQKACLNPNEMRFDWLKLIDVRYLIVQDENSWNITELSQGLGRIFSVKQVVNISNDHCLDDLKMIDPLNVVLIEGEVLDHHNGSFEIIDQYRDINNEIFHVKVNHSTTLLVRSENWAPGWKATIDGHSVNVYKANCVLQGVWVEEGIHIIEFDYQPFGYPIGFWISSLTLIGLIILIMILIRKTSNS